MPVCVGVEVRARTGVCLVCARTPTWCMSPAGGVNSSSSRTQRSERSGWGWRVCRRQEEGEGEAD